MIFPQTLPERSQREPVGLVSTPLNLRSAFIHQIKLDGIVSNELISYNFQTNHMDAIYDSTQQKHDPQCFLQNGIAQLNRPTVLVQEVVGLCDALGPNLVSFLSGFADG